jgi:DNA primase
MDPVLSVKSRLPIEQLVGSYCQLKKKGRNYVALCPFHNDTHPSLLVSPDKGIAYCFACRSGGDIFSFYQSIEGVNFRQALQDLAEKTGVPLPKRTATKDEMDEREKVRSCLLEASSFFRRKLLKSSHAQAYLQKRQIGERQWEEFAIGYAPDSFDALYTELLKKGFARSTILQAGLAIQKELAEERMYDRFRNRILFPIADPTGRIIGFGGRAIEESDAKYINSPDGLLYHKSLVLFGLPQAKEAMRRERNAILVEGYIDALACHACGIKNVVATCGTALTEQHAILLRRYVEEATLCLDMDAAGWGAQVRAYSTLLSKELTVSCMVLPVGKDPDECRKTDPQLLRGAWEKRTPFLDRLREKAEEDLKSDPIRAPRILQLLFLQILSAIPSEVEREKHLATFAGILRTPVTALRDDLQHFRKKQSTTAMENKRSVTKPPFCSLELLLGLLLTYPDARQEFTNLIPPDGDDAPSLYRELKEASDRGAWPASPDDLREDVREQANILRLYCEEHFGTWSASHAQREVRSLLRRVNGETLRRRQSSLLSSLKQAREEGKKAEEQKLLTTYQKVLKLVKMAR